MAGEAIGWPAGGYLLDEAGNELNACWKTGTLATIRD
jgi:hypothetical protein